MSPRRSQKGNRSKGARKGGRGRDAHDKAQRSPSRERGTTPVRSGNGGGKSLGGEQVEGRQAVRELLLVGRRKAREVLLASDMDPAPILEDIIDLADENKVAIREISRGRFESLRKTEAPQGVIAMAAPLPITPIEQLANTGGASPPFLLVLDGVTDPGNVGAILRTAEAAGVTGVVFPAHRAARITATVTKAAAGAVEHLPMAMLSGIPTAISVLKEHEVWTVALDGAGEGSVFDLQVADQPLALVLGAESTGVSRLVRERCDVVAAIPLTGRMESLNVAAAAAVACFEVVRRRRAADS